MPVRTLRFLIDPTITLAQLRCIGRALVTIRKIAGFSPETLVCKPDADWRAAELGEALRQTLYIPNRVCAEDNSLVGYDALSMLGSLREIYLPEEHPILVTHRPLLYGGKASSLAVCGVANLHLAAIISSDGNLFRGEGGDENFETLALHELGHFLGLVQTGRYQSVRSEEYGTHCTSECVMRLGRYDVKTDDRINSDIPFCALCRKGLRNSALHKPK